MASRLQCLAFMLVGRFMTFGSFLAVAACGNSGTPCPALECPATYINVSVEVTGPDAGALTGVVATLSGPVTDTMSCQPSGAAALCTWSPPTPVTAGTYSLQVSAPGFQTANTSAIVKTVGASGCGCPGATIQPSSVALQ